MCPFLSFFIWKQTFDNFCHKSIGFRFLKYSNKKGCLENTWKTFSEWMKIFARRYSNHPHRNIHSLPYFYFTVLIQYKFYSIPITITKGNKKGTQRTTRVNLFPLLLHKCLSLFSYLFFLFLVYSYECVMIPFNGMPMEL